MSEGDKRVKAFEKLMRGGLFSTDVYGKLTNTCITEE